MSTFIYFIFQLMTDVSFNVGFDEAAREQLEHTDKPIYAFHFKLFSTENPLKPLMYGESILNIN